MALSRLAIDALLTTSLWDEVRTFFSHITDFEYLQGYIYFMMNVKGAQDDLESLQLASFSEENVSSR